MVLPSCLALPCQIPALCFLRAEMFVEPFEAIRDFASPYVKLLAPAIGAPGLLPSVVFMAGLCGAVVSAAKADPTMSVAEVDIGVS